jgi:GDPmannose 4,6-dehydratase
MESKLKALITGTTGQDGSYLADLLLSKGYEVYGLVRRSSTDNKWRIKKALDNGLILIDGDITDAPCLNFIFSHYGPFDECYNLAAQSDVGLSWKQPLSTAKITGLGCLNLLEAIRTQNPECKFYQASTSELYGGCNSSFRLTETIPFHPRSPYGCAKAFAHHLTVNYRESYGLFAACGILFNHESPRRGDNFVTQKIVKAGLRIKAGQQETLSLGNLDAMRDWSHAKDMVRGMWLILQNEKPEEFVLASGYTHSVRFFLDAVFSKLELPIEKHVIINQDLYRPAEVHILCGDPTKARNILDWKPEYSLDDLIDDMIAGE